MTRAKRPVRGGMKVRAYPVLYRDVEEGVAYGVAAGAEAHRQTGCGGDRGADSHSCGK